MRRIRQFSESATKIFPVESRAIDAGKRKLASTAEPSSPLKPAFPLPATLETIPLAELTLNILCWPTSEMNRLPSESMASPLICSKLAERADEPSAVSPDLPVPATVEINPVRASTLRTCHHSAI